MALNAVSKEVVALERRPGGAQFKDVQHLVSGARGKTVYETGDLDAGIWSAGITIGLIHDIPSCEELVNNMERDAEAHIARLAKLAGRSQANL